MSLAKREVQGVSRTLSGLLQAVSIIKNFRLGDGVFRGSKMFAFPEIEDERSKSPERNRTFERVKVPVATEMVADY